MKRTTRGALVLLVLAASVSGGDQPVEVPVTMNVALPTPTPGESDDVRKLREVNEARHARQVQIRAIVERIAGRANVPIDDLGDTIVESLPTPIPTKR